MSFYTFSQNNSGGGFDYDEQKGIAEYVIIEALDADQANKKAQEIGIYFDGCVKELDCSCCGDRWYETYEGAAKETPSIYGDPVESFKPLLRLSKGYTAFVHYADGSIKGFLK